MAEKPAANDHDANACTACRATGTVLSGLGGTPHPVRCPWCEGTGRRIPDHDAQAVAPANGARGSR